MKTSSLKKQTPFILGIDLGTTSVGWALLQVADGTPVSVLRCGVRIFEAGVKGSIEQGKDSSRAAVRREKRLARRQIWRRTRRAGKVFSVLQRLKLLPESVSNDCKSRHAVLHELDTALRKKYLRPDSPASPHVLPYELRARAASEPFRECERFELGRALFHLAQRRGYLSNRKSAEKTGAEKADEQDGVVKRAIGDLAAKLNGRTLGQYFASLNPLECRIRCRWTSREMYTDEFNRILALQSEVMKLTEDDRNALHDAIFSQRPLKSQRNLVGRCDLEPRKRRAVFALPIAQEFRILQSVNHLRVRCPDEAVRELSLSEKKKLYLALDAAGSMTFAVARKLLGFSQKGTHFTIEESGEKELIGNRTRSKLEPIFGDRWTSLTAQERDQITLEVLDFQKASALVRRAVSAWGLSQENAERLSEVRLESARARHSVPALRRLVEKMREGVAYATARKEAYPESFNAGKIYETLPPILNADRDLRNPSVCRALTELRKVVNAIIRRYGKPEKIRIELARELKKSRKERMTLTEKLKEQTKKREEARQRILLELPGYSVRHGFDPAVEKVLLAEECNWQCPFTDDPISMAALIGTNPQFDVAHIYPRRYLDDSFLNKTLCRHDVNRHRMHDLLPFQAFGANTTKNGEVLAWHDVLQRVKAFRGRAAKVKLERFQQSEVPEDFVSSQLNDTRYITVRAADYLGMLYGGRVDGEGVRRIECLTGGITGLLRSCWGLFKSRDDHRHHALDAVIVGLTDAGTVSILQKQAEIASARGLRLTKVTDFPQPWPGFVQQIQQRIDEIQVSHRVDHRIGGALHAESNYSAAIHRHGERSAERHIRTSLFQLTAKDLAGDAIVDPAVRRLVQERFRELGAGDPKKVFAAPENHPFMTAKDGRRIPIHRVRVRVGVKPRAIGRGPTVRYVALKSNHHAIVFVHLDEKDRESKWDGDVVSRLDAAARMSREAKAAGTQVVNRELGPKKRFKFSLCPGDSVLMHDEEGVERLFRVKSISKSGNGPDIEFQLHSDARESKELKRQKRPNRISKWADFGARHVQKVNVSPLGEWIRARE